MVWPLAAHFGQRFPGTFNGISALCRCCDIWVFTHWSLSNGKGATEGFELWLGSECWQLLDSQPAKGLIAVHTVGHG